MVIPIVSNPPSSPASRFGELRLNPLVGEWTVDIATDTCYFYSDIKIVNGWTACVDYGQTYTAECGSDCSLVNYWYALSRLVFSALSMQHNLLS